MFTPLTVVHRSRADRDVEAGSSQVNGYGFADPSTCSCNQSDTVGFVTVMDHQSKRRCEVVTFCSDQRAVAGLRAANTAKHGPVSRLQTG